MPNKQTLTTPRPSVSTSSRCTRYVSPFSQATKALRESKRYSSTLFLDHGTRRGKGSASRPGHFTPGKDHVPIVQEWASVPVWTGAENLAPTGIRSPDRPVRSQSLYRLSYPAHSRSAIQFFLTEHITLNLENNAKFFFIVLNSHTKKYRSPYKTDLTAFPSNTLHIRFLCK
jgi:hypothetical protein